MMLLQNWLGEGRKCQAAQSKRFSLPLLGILIMLLVGGGRAQAQGTVIGVSVTASPTPIQAYTEQPASFGAAATTGTPKPGSEWKVVDGPHYHWSVSPDAGSDLADSPEITAMVSYATPGSYQATASCTVSYTVQQSDPGQPDDGTLATISGTGTGSVTVNVDWHRKWDPSPQFTLGFSPVARQYILPGTQVACSVSGSDEDTLTTDGQPSQVGDTLIYQWSGGNLTGDLTGPSATWMAPSAPGTYSCTVFAQDTAQMEPKDAGSRKDASITTTFYFQVPNKVWTPGAPITGGDLVGPAQVTADPGSPVSFSVSAASDTDHWTQSSPQGTLASGDEADGIKYHWTGPGLNSASAGGSWTAPTVPGTYTLTCTISDFGGPVISPDTGNRTDSSLTRSIIVTVPNKVWDTGDPITGGVLNVPAEVTIAPGGSVGYGVSAASDTDHWTQGSQQGTEADGIHYAWSASGGAFSDSAAASGSWTAPATPGTYTLRCTVTDTGGPVVSPDTGTRQDAPPAAQTITVQVVNTPVKLTADKSALCAGGWSPAYQYQYLQKETGQVVSRVKPDPHIATLTATVKDDQSKPVPGRTVTFTWSMPAVDGSGNEAPLMESRTAVTDSSGVATCDVTSGNEVANAVSVTATCKEGSDTVSLDMQAASVDWQYQSIDANGNPTWQEWDGTLAGLQTGTDTSVPIPLQAVVTFNGMAVIGHSMNWMFSQVLDEAGNVVLPEDYGPYAGQYYGYGHFSGPISTTDKNGTAIASFSIGFSRGQISMEIDDENVFDASVM